MYRRHMFVGWSRAKPVQERGFNLLQKSVTCLIEVTVKKTNLGKWAGTIKFVNLLSPNSRSKTNFSFQFIASYVWYSIEKLAGDLLLGLKLV